MEILEIIDESKNLIVDSLALNISSQNNAFRENTDKHISLTLLDNPKHLKYTVLKLLQFYIKESNSKSVIGFTQNNPYLIVLAIQASLNEHLPFYSYDLENDSNSNDNLTKTAQGPCSLIIPYSIDENHVLKIVDRFSQQKISISQVISMIDENSSKMNFSNQEFDFVSICNWNSLKNRINHYHNLTNEKMDQLMTNFT